MRTGTHDPAYWTTERRQEQGTKVARGLQRSSRLSWADVRKIRAAHKRGETNEMIASWYGMHFANIACITRNFTWHDPAYEPRLTRVCALPSCGAEFTTMNVAQRFCDPKHRQLHNRRVKQGYYSRRLQRCSLGRRRASTHERARCACVGCVEMLLALAQEPIEQAINLHGRNLDPDDAAQLVRAAALEQLPRFAAKPDVRWQAFVHRLGWSVLGNEQARARAIKRGGHAVTLHLDQELGDGTATLGDVIAAPGADPLDELGSRSIADALGDLTLEDVEQLTPLGLARLRERLRRAGITPEALAA